MKKFLFLSVEKVLFPVLCFFFPMRRELLLFGSGFGRFADNPKFLFLYFQNNLFYKPVWISSNLSEVVLLRKKGYDCLYKWSPKAFLAVVRASVWCVSHKVNDVFPFIPDRTILINLWHGTPIKKIGFDSLKEKEWIEKTLKSGRKLPYERWNYFIASSEKTKFIFKSAMRLKEQNIKALGQPRNQLIYEAMKNKARLRFGEKKSSILKESGDKTRILYTPTFRNNEASTEYIKRTLIRIDSILKIANKQVLLFKRHPLDKVTFNHELFEEMTHVVDVSSEDTQELLCKSDVLITDYSSILFDFMITGRPIIAYVFDKKAYIQENGGLYFSFNNLGTHIANDEEELLDLLTRVETLSNEYDSSDFNVPSSGEKIASFIEGLH